MKRLAIACVLLSLASGAHAQDLPTGWARVTRIVGGTPTAAACTASTAYLRDWSGTVVAFDGTSGVRLASAAQSAYGRSISVDASGHAMIATPVGLAISDGSAWTIVPVAGDHVEVAGVLALDETHAYFVTDGAIGVREEDHFTRYAIGTWRSLEAIAGRSPSDLWVAGQGGTVMHWDGRGWAREATNSDLWLHGIAVGRTDVWAWSGASILRRDAVGAWATLASPVGTVVSVATTRTDTFVVGDTGVARRTDGGWVTELTAAALGEYASFSTACATEHWLAVVLSSGDVLTRAL